MDLTYSFGGTQTTPHVRRVVPYTPDPELCLQDNLLQRTDALLQDLCLVFDGARAAFDAAGTDDTAARAHAMDTMMGAVRYATRVVLMPCPSAKYLLMQQRATQALERAATMAPHQETIVTECLNPMCEALEYMSTCFIDTGTNAAE